MKPAWIIAIAPMAAFSSCAMHSVESAPVIEEVELFDGKTLKGWRVTQENPESFRVENGAIVASGPRAHLYYDGEHGNRFKDFVLTLEVKTQAGSNSGVFFHSQYQANDWPKRGIEAQVNVSQGDPRKTGSLFAVAEVRVIDDKSKAPVLGVDYNPYAVIQTAPHADDEWFEYKIEVRDDIARTFVDGRIIVEWRQPADWPEADRRLSSGTFALQAHDPDSTVHYRSIRLQKLP